MRRLLSALGLFLILGTSAPSAQTIHQTGGPPGAVLGGAAAWEGGIWASGRTNGVFRAAGGVWGTEPRGERLGELFSLGGALYGFNGSQLARRDADGRWPLVFEDYIIDLSVTADSILVLSDDTLYTSADGDAWRMAQRGREVVDGDGQPTGDLIVFILEAVQTPDGAFWISAFSTTTGTLFHSADGIAWRDVSAGTPVFSLARALTATRNGTLFAELNSGVYRRDPGADAWVFSSEGLPDIFSARRFVESEAAVFLMGYGTEHQLFRWNGAVWQDVALPPDATVFDIAPADDGLYVVTANGLFTGNGDGTWVALHDGVIASQATPYALGDGLAALTTNGWVRSQDGGATWTEAPFPSFTALYDLGAVAIGTAADDVYRSTDGGTTWTLANAGIKVGPFHKRRFLDVVQAPDGTIYGGLMSSRAIKHQGGEVVGGVYRSTNGGQSWSLYGSGFPVNANGFRAGVHQLASTPTHLIASTQEGLVRIAHGSSGWEPLASPTSVSVLSLDALGDRVVLVTYNAIHRSDDAGLTWTSHTSGLPEKDFGRLVATDGEDVYLLLRPFVEPVTGLYRMTETGWEDTGVDVPDWVSWSRAVVQGDGLYLGSYNHGVWFADPSGVTTASDPGRIPIRPELAPLAPNPAAAQATSTLMWPTSGRVEAVLYDLLGRRVLTVFEGEVRAGAPVSLVIPTHRLPGGHYVLRATGAGYGVSQRLTTLGR